MNSIQMSFQKYIEHNIYFKKILIFFYKYTPKLIGLIYILFCTYLILMNDFYIIKTLVKPFFAICISTFIRFISKRNRPFVKYKFTPIIGFKKGNSFPSNHATSAMIISLVILNFNIYLGIILLFLSLIVVITRYLIGIHFISDLLFGLTIAIVISYI